MGLEIKNVKCVFPINQSELTVLQDISLTVEDGEIISIVGESGCGKSTLLRIIAGLEQATEGEIRLDGSPMRKEDMRSIGIVFQEPRLFPWSNVEKNIVFGITGKMQKEEQKKAVQDHINLVGLQGFEKALPDQLSGGMKQRVNIARSLINCPKVLLLDEPFGALDAFTKINMQKEILKIWEEERMTMLLVTHDIDEAIYLGDRVVVMSAKPGIVKDVIKVSIPRERDRTSSEFAYYRKRVYDNFFEKKESQPEYII
ncbi:MAG: ABC transporter ATP-binding protein [Clostridiales bacterium]|nr:ABC transporter ATP-binding protein [Clostridiales bacterium]